MTAGRTTVADLVAERNAAKHLFTAGPASLLEENILGLRPCFGRGDGDYDRVEASVLDSLRAMTGHSHLVRLQGSATLALEIAVSNFAYGRVLVVESGYYSHRLYELALSAQKSFGAITRVDAIDYQDLHQASGRYDWILACRTETSRAILVPIAEVAALAGRTGAKVLLDATASIGLENGHEAADVLAYSSCKGLFGLTGASFVAHNVEPTVEVPSLYLNLRTHAERRTTGPYHAISSLFEVLPRHADFRAAVAINKARCLSLFADEVTVAPSYQPLLCTHLQCDLVAREPSAVLYVPRDLVSGSVVCHLGEVHLGAAARGDILMRLERVP